jgi:hypothetical protein
VECHEFVLACERGDRKDLVSLDLLVLSNKSQFRCPYPVKLEEVLLLDGSVLTHTWCLLSLFLKVVFIKPLERCHMRGGFFYSFFSLSLCMERNLALG